MIYTAVIGDLIDSKKLEKREEVQEQLLNLMKKINQKYHSVIVSPFTVTTGDEFQALLTPCDNIFQLIDEITAVLDPVEVRFGLGIGRMSTPINKEQSIGSDGPAFWLARAAIDSIHDKNDYGTSHIALHCDSPLVQSTVNSLLSSGDFIKSKWTANQAAILRALLAKGIYQEQFEHQKLAETLGIKPSGFTKRLKASGLKHYLRSRNAAAAMILNTVQNKEDGHA
ncbi:SatD family protein [Streptococcus sp. H31]|uniref:SatD family protein n=1 Tax=Streptococcus huangxiaojuni TaxID=3237239 RepID=UPI0034A4B1A6